MTVEELIKELQKCEQDASVYVYTGDINFLELTEVEQTAPAMVVVSNL